MYAVVSLVETKGGDRGWRGLLTIGDESMHSERATFSLAHLIAA
jgi:hypothetical protein